MPAAETPTDRRLDVQRTADGSTIEAYLYDSIGRNGKSGISARDFVEAVRRVGPADEIVLHINSPGGSIHEGTAIYNFLKGREEHVTVHIDGVAASAAATIAMSGDTRIISSSAMMMIHCGWSTDSGMSAAEMRKEAKTLEKLDEIAAGIYASATGLSAESIGAMMEDETWMDADEALSYGFATEIAYDTEPAMLVGFARSDIDGLKFRHPEHITPFMVNDEKVQGKTMSKKTPAEKKNEDATKKKSSNEEETDTAPDEEKDAETETDDPPDDTATGEACTACGAMKKKHTGRDFLNSFGPQGGVWYAEGRSFAHASALHAKAMTAKISEQNKTIADLTKRLNAAVKAMGDEGVSADAADESDAAEDSAKKREALVDAVGKEKADRIMELRKKHAKKRAT